MIQRIQSIYLLLVSVLMCVTVTSPLMSFVDNAGNVLLLKGLGFFLDTQKIYPTWGIISVGLLVALFALIEIFSYKNRKKQMRLSAINMLLILFFYATLAVYAYFGQKSLGITISKVEYGLILPLIALIFNLLAFIRIKKDEKLVRSLDRIR